MIEPRIPALSVRMRLTLWYSGVLFISLVSFAAVVYTTLSRTLEREVDDGLVDQARDVVSNMVVFQASSDGAWQAVLPHLDVFGAPSLFVQMISAAGEVTTRSLNLSEAELPVGTATLETMNTGQAIFETVSVEGRTLRIYGIPLYVQGRPIAVLQVGRSLAPIEEALGNLQSTLLIVAAASLGLAGLAGWMLGGAALRPLDRLSSAAAAIGESQDFNRRVEHSGARDQIGRLAETFNQMLERLQDAYSRLESANRGLGAALDAQRRFIADASHELRTPLTAIRGNVGLLQRVTDLSPRDREETLGDLSSEVERMSRLVNDLLLLARADAGAHLQLGPVDLVPVLRSAVREARFLSDGVAVRLEDVPGEVWVNGDPDRLTQILLILLDNAVKYTPGGGQVMVSASLDGERVRVAVRDTGVGISTDELPRVFDRFFRGDRARPTDGAGLGLSIARWIADEHRGTIRIQSTPNNGTAATLTLTAIAAPVEAQLALVS
ncbi:MAG: sensor histidine kinase [Chloroflexota bacterium]